MSEMVNISETVDMSDIVSVDLNEFNESSKYQASLYNKQRTFVTLLEDFPIILSKSQQPHIKAGKAKAAEKVMAEYQKLCGITLTKDQLFKKLCNIKSTIKAKSDDSKGTGCAVLSDWEHDFLQLVETATNSSFSPMQGTIKIKFPQKRPLERNDENDVNEPKEPMEESHKDDAVESEQNKADEPAPSRKRSKPLPHQPKTLSRPNAGLPETFSRPHAGLPETDETKNLTNSQLKRLVLLEQLRLIRMQQRQFQNFVMM